MVATLITLVPKARSSDGATAWQQAACGLVKNAPEPSGSGPYVEAIREWIERVTPRSPSRGQMRLVGGAR